MSLPIVSECSWPFRVSAPQGDPSSLPIVRPAAVARHGAPSGNASKKFEGRFEFFSCRSPASAGRESEGNEFAIVAAHNLGKEIP